MARLKSYGHKRKKDRDWSSGRIGGDRVERKFDSLPGGDTRKHTVKSSFGYVRKKATTTGSFSGSLIIRDANTGKIIARKSDKRRQKRGR